MAQQKLNKAGLTPRQLRLVEEMADPNQKSIRSASINAGYSPRSANAVANETLKNPKVRKAIEQRKKELSRLADVTRENILGALAAIAFASPVDVLDEKGDFDLQKALATGAIHAIKKLTFRESNEGKTVTVEFCSRIDALFRLADYHGITEKGATSPLGRALNGVETMMKLGRIDMRTAMEEILQQQVGTGMQMIDPEVMHTLARQNGIANLNWR